MNERDVRLRTELASRRKIIAVVRQFGRVLCLHALDALALWAAIEAVGFLTGQGMPTPGTSVGLIMLSLLALNSQAAYRPGPGRRDFRRLVTAMGVGGLLVLLTPLLTGTAVMPIQNLVGFVLLGGAGLVAERFLVDQVLRRVYSRGIGLRRAIILAPGHLADTMVRDLTGPSNPDQQVVGYVTPDSTPDGKALGSVGELAAIIEDLDIQEILLTWPVGQTVVERVTDACFDRGVKVLVMPWAPGWMHAWSEPVRIGSSVAYHLHPTKLRMPVLMVKRAGDLVLTTLSLVLVLPLMALIAITIKLDSRGPVFFRQRRVGVGGRHFMMWKFRSMASGSEHRVGELAHLNQYPNQNLFKMQNDPRITRVGRVLRRLSLDELPQLFNVLAGDMSLVGPRPPLPKEVESYKEKHMVRLTVVPGITGPWQVSGRNLISDFDEVVRLEREYIEHWTLGLDAKILLQTIGVVVSGKGAY